MPKIIVIVNASSGCGHTKEWVSELVEKFNRHDAQVQIALARSGEEILARARAALVVADKPLAVVAGGGDGTVNAVASVLAGSDVALGVLPLGTLNHFAKDLAVPLDLDAAVDNIFSGERVAIDVGEVNGRVFINNSSLGIYPKIVRSREQQQHRFGTSKWLAFARACLAALRRYSFLHVRMHLDETLREQRTPFVFIGNNEYVMQGFSIGARTRLDAGLLSVYVAQRAGRLSLVRLAVRALFGHLHQASDFIAMTSTELTVETEHHHLRVATNGEVTVMETPLRYRIRPGALHVIVPKKPDEAQNALQLADEQNMRQPQPVAATQV